MGAGHSGHFVVAHHPESLSELPIFREIVYQTTPYTDDDPGYSPIRGSRPGGWHLLEVRYGLGSDRDWLGEMVAMTRAR